MPHLYPVVIPGGQSVRGASLGFHAYSLRVDNLSNQWLQEQTTLAWIPPYSLGTCLRLYGAAVALVLNTSPTGQPQLQPIAGEYASGFFSDEYRTEVAGVPVRQFTLVQTVSDLTQGPEPAFPPVGVDRLWADTMGRIHHLHSDGSDYTLVDPSQTGVVTSGMILDGTIQNADLAAGVAAANVGALGGVLTGTLPNPGLNLNGQLSQVNLGADVGGGNLNNTALWFPFSSVAAGTYLAGAFIYLQNSSGVTISVDAWIAPSAGGYFAGVNQYKSFIAMSLPASAFASGWAIALVTPTAGANIGVYFQTTPNPTATILLKQASQVGGWQASSAFLVKLG